jgi:penicillin-insensitive murein endopeptidase
VLVRLDLPRTWAFVRALLEDRSAIRCSASSSRSTCARCPQLRGARARAAQDPDRFGELTCQPSAPHDDHFHIRFFCTPEDIAAGCQDATPVYSWRRRALRELDVTPVLYRPTRDRPESPTVSPAQARAQAGRVHARVNVWLARRTAWLEPPETDRFCNYALAFAP